MENYAANGGGGMESNMSIYKRLANVFNGLDPEQREDLPVHVKWLEDALVSVSTEEEAAAAFVCSPLPEPLDEIAKRAGLDKETMLKNLEGAGEAGIVMMSYLDEKREIIGYYRPGMLPGLAETLATGKRVTREGVYWIENYCKTYNRQIYPNSAPYRGGFRALPVREAIKAETKIAKYDEIEPYLEQNEDFSVANCACRTSTKMLGYGCEHTEIETCIQMGPCAQSFIMTGRGRKVSREEVKQILKRCEREGLVHQLMAVEKGKTMFLCNCCGCSCIALQVQNMLNLQESARSNYEPEIDVEKCVGCGSCVEYCNMNALSLGCKLVAEPVKFESRPDPLFTEWTEELWNKDHMKREMVNDQGTSPCKTHCPAHISVQGYIRKAAEGKYDEALKVIKRDNPFPAVCGRICPHNCEKECSRGKVDEGIAIDDIKKFIADKELEAGHLYVPEVYDHWTEKVAIIGAGPAGMTAAYFLAQKGYPVTIFERQSMPGGMLKFGIPTFRLEKDVIDAEIEVLRKLGVEFRCGVDVGKDITIQGLREQGYKAFYIAIGAQNGRKLNVEGEDLKGVNVGLDFLRAVNHNEAAPINGDAIVIGGGNVAVDVARAAVRLGAGSVKIYCLEKDEEMPSVPEEKEEAIGEGIQINNSWGPIRIVGENGKVTGVEFKRCVSVFDENEKFAPVYDDSETVIVPCENVYITIGQAIDWGALLDGAEATFGRDNVMKVADISYQSGIADVFGGGDCVTGPLLVIDAIATGKSGAISIHRFLRDQGLLVRREREYHTYDEDKADFSSFDRMPRQRPLATDHKKAVETMNDLRTILTEEQLKKEAERCLGCGVSVLNPARCIGCGLCYTRCEFDAICLNKVADIVPPDTIEEYMKIVTDYAMERAKNLAAQGVDTGGVSALSYDHFKKGRKGE